MTYMVEQIKVKDGQIVSTTVLFEHKSMKKALTYWESYASGVNDVNPYDHEEALPFGETLLPEQRYYRIVPSEIEA